MAPLLRSGPIGCDGPTPTFTSSLAFPDSVEIGNNSCNPIMSEAERQESPPSTEEAAAQDVPRDPHIDVDDAPADEGYTTDAQSTTSTSIASSVRDYQFENSRRYHKFKEGLYQFPNDVPEQEREDMKHTVAVHLLGGKLHNAPLEDPQKIVDIGTGTGSWAIDSAP